jgi:hypothetical protein
MRKGAGMSEPVLVVLAAGIGSRYGGIKQIDPIGPNGELIIDYSVYDALRAGFQQVVFVINKEIEAIFRERVGETIEKQCQTAYIFQEVQDLPAGFQVPPDRHKPWGTAHATLLCRSVIDAPFAVINADDFYGRSSYQVLHDYLEGAGDRDGIYDYCMVGFKLEHTLTEHGHVSRGVCSVDGDGFLLSIRERTRVRKFDKGMAYSENGEDWSPIPTGSIASMNMWGFTPSLFSELETRFVRFLQESSGNLETAEFFLPEIVGDLIGEGKGHVKVLPTPERWFGVTYQQDKPEVRKALRALIDRGAYPETLWE